jgi:hypothetical protein
MGLDCGRGAGEREKGRAAAIRENIPLSLEELSYATEKRVARAGLPDCRLSIALQSRHHAPIGRDAQAASTVPPQERSNGRGERKHQSHRLSGTPACL